MSKRRGGTRLAGLMVLILPLVVSFTADSPLASIVTYFDDAGLLRSSRLVIAGRVVSISSAWDWEDRNIYTYIGVIVDEAIKGEVKKGQIIFIKQLGGMAEGISSWIFGSPEFEVGEEVLLFLQSSSDGTLQVTGLFQGKMRIRRARSGERLLERSARPEGVRVLRGGLSAAADGEISQPLRADEYIRGLRELVAEGPELTVKGIRLVPPELGKLQMRSIPRFNFELLLGGVRWFEFDSNIQVPYFMRPEGEASLPGGGFDQVRQGYSAWNSVASAKVLIKDGGTTTTGSGFRFDGVNTISFGDPLNQIQDPTGCSGALAIGGVFVSSETMAVNGQSFRRIVEADVVFNNGFGCFLGVSANMAEVATHEIGHTLGLGHSTDPDAIMRATAHGNGRGSRLGSDDIAGISFIYPSGSSPPPSPVISVSPSSLSFSARQGEANPSPQAFTITNAGGGILTWTASSNASWLSINPTQGTAPTNVTASVNISGLASGSYQGRIAITAQGATNSPFIVEVTLTVAPPSPLISASPGALSFSARKGGANPTSQTLAIRNGGAGMLQWTANVDVPWLSISPTAGTAPSDLIVSANIAGLRGGSYQGKITVSAQGASNSPVTVAVTLTIANDPPIARAGASQTVAAGALVTLDGSASSDPNGDPLTYRWVQTGGPSVALTGANTSKPSFTAPITTADTTLTFQLTVNDGEVDSAPASTSVTVLRRNDPPVANAGSDKIVNQRTVVTLDGIASYDPNGDPISFRWVQLSGPAVELQNATGPQATFVAPNVSADTKLSFQLTVNDGRTASQPDVVEVTVLAELAGLIGEYYRGTGFGERVFTRLDPQISYFLGAEGIDFRLPRDNFSVRWSGAIKIDRSETYTFYILSDDGVRLYIDGQLVINNFTFHGPTEDRGSIALSAGLHSVRLEWFEGGGAAFIALWYSSPSLQRQLVPASKLVPIASSGNAAATGGLRGDYYDSMDFTDPVFSRTDPLLSFGYGLSAPSPLMDADGFSVVWSGLLMIDSDDIYTFYTLSDDGVRLYIDGRLVINNWTDHGPTEDRASIRLQPGLHRLRLEYYENGAAAALSLEYSSPNLPRQLVPASRLIPAENLAPQIGFRGEYFADIGFSRLAFVRVDPEINFMLGLSAIDPRLGADNFSVRWAAEIEIDKGELYTFYTLSDDGVRLTIDGQVVINNFTFHGPTEDQGQILLSQGRHKLVLEWFEGTVVALIRLEYSSPSQPRSQIPTDKVFPAVKR